MVVYESLGWGDGNVDLVRLASDVTKKVILDVIAELKQNLPSG